MKDIRGTINEHQSKLWSVREQKFWKDWRLADLLQVKRAGCCSLCNIAANEHSYKIEKNQLLIFKCPTQKNECANPCTIGYLGIPYGLRKYEYNTELIKIIWDLLWRYALHYSHLNLEKKKNVFLMKLLHTVLMPTK